jgi:hypothetical protein
MTRGADLAGEVVVNNHNYADYLAAAIDSARAQTHPRLRVVVVDDGSTDGSRQILERYGSEVTVVLKEQAGQASALNAAMPHCQGDFVIFLDADDVLRPEAAARVAAAFAADPAVAKVQYRMDVIDAAGNPTGTIKPSPHLPMPRGDLKLAELAYPFDITWMAMSGNAFRGEALRRVMPIPAAAYPRSGADWYLVHLTTLLGKVESLDQVCASYRVHGRNSYEPQSAELSLAHVRKAIVRSAPTADALLGLAGELGLPRPARILSLADLANRMISLRLDPQHHPLPEDTVTGILSGAVGAVRRRDNVSPTMKAAFLAWFLAVAVSPRPLARPLAVLFLFPERRRRFNLWLSRKQGYRPTAAG